ncbi:hexuronate transporter [Enterobacter cancerogenus]|uniref:Hexuronate transporter n=1 Tax=Enterobacter cancerogenus TaxID=69218 RepID=A0A484Z952_9ENTR|nr:hexuronate transporter [Enterobacter cancerogenus]
MTVNYITHNSLGSSAPELKESLGITTEQYSWIVGAFQIAYTLFQPLCGWLIDVIGLKIGFMVCAGLWALMCIFHAGAGSWLHLAILRFFMGASEAAATPANAKTIGEWFPKSERPVAAGWAGVGFSVGAMLARPIIYFCPCLVRLAGRVYVYRRAGAAVGDFMVGVLPQPGAAPEPQQRGTGVY